MPAQPPHLTLPNYVRRLIALNRSSRSPEFTKPLLSVHSPFDRAMVLLDDVVQILDGSVAAPTAERPLPIYVGDGRAVNRRQIRVMPGVEDGKDRSTRCGTDVWRHRHRAVPTIENRWWHRTNRSPGTGSTSLLLPEGRFHRPATTCSSASGAGAVVAPIRGRNAAPIA
jgi:hypothetical protein